MVKKYTYAKTAAAGQFPLLTPKSDWVIPKELPDLRRAGIIAMDTETKDDGLAQGRGAGWAYHAGHICGVSVAWKGGQLYIPLRHPETENFNIENVGRWIDDHFCSDLRIIFQNAAYDLGWITTEWDGVVDYPFHMEDTQAAAFIVDENRFSYSLDNLCEWQGVPGKDQTLLAEAAAAYCGAKTEREIKSSIYKLPARYAGPYGEQDGRSTYDLYHKLEPQIKDLGMWDAYRLEVDLIPMGIDMRRRGVRVDVDYALESKDKLLKQRDVLLKEITRKSSFGVGREFTISDLSSEVFLEKLFTAEQVPFPRTLATKNRPNGTPSFKAEWMEKREHWLPQSVAKVAQLQDAGKKFIGDYILGYAHRGRIHAEINFTKVKTTRLSYNDPPLQQMTSPDKHPDIGKIIRNIFLPEQDEVWGALDYSQQEPGLTVHFASLCKIHGAETAVDYYHNAPKPDYHTMVANMTAMPRPKAKIINLGLAYGMGVWKLAAALGVSLEEAKRILDQYHDAVPFIRGLTEYCSRLVEKRGWIKLIDGARCRFDLWEPRWREKEEEYAWIQRGNDASKLEACGLQEAQRRIQDSSHPWSGRLKRAFAHKAMNRLIQGSAARQTKLAMRECYTQKIIPLIQMHDELDFSFGDQRIAKIAKEIMISIVPLRVPVRVDDEYGLRWGNAKQKLEEVFKHAA